MKITLAIFCILACGTSAAAQYGVSNARDGSGNLIRNNGTKPVTNQGSVSGPTMNVPAPSPTTNSRLKKGTSK